MALQPCSPGLHRRPCPKSMLFFRQGRSPCQVSGFDHLLGPLDRGKPSPLLWAHLTSHLSSLHNYVALGRSKTRESSVTLVLSGGPGIRGMEMKMAVRHTAQQVGK